MFLIFQEKSFAFPENVNEEVSSNKNDEVATMMAAVPKLSYAVSHYASYRLRANVQFSATENIVLSRWIFTEAHIGKILLDTH